MHIIIAGSGSSSTQNVGALLTDFLESIPGQHTFYWAVDHHWNDAHTAMFDTVFPADGETDHLVEIVTTTADPTDAAAAFLGEFDGEEFIRVSAPARKAVLLAFEEAGRKPDELAVIALYDEDAAEDDDPAYDALDEASRVGVTRLYDITNAMQEIVLGPPETVESDFPSEEDLNGMDRDALIDLAKRENLTLSKRAHTTTYVTTLNEHFRSLESAGVAAEDVEDAAKAAAGDPEPAQETSPETDEPETTPDTSPALIDISAELVGKLADGVAMLLAPGWEDIRKLVERRVSLIDDKLNDLSNRLADLDTGTASLSQEVKDLSSAIGELHDAMKASTPNTGAAVTAKASAPAAETAAPKRAIRRRTS